MAATETTRLNTLQISLLRLFDRGLSESQLLELKRVLVRHYANLLHEEVDSVMQERHYTQADFDRMLTESDR